MSGSCFGLVTPKSESAFGVLDPPYGFFLFVLIRKPVG